MHPDLGQLVGQSLHQVVAVAVEQGDQGVDPLVGGVPAGDDRLAAQAVDAPEQFRRDLGEPGVEVLVGERGYGAPEAAHGERLDPRRQDDRAFGGAVDEGQGPVDGPRVDEVGVDFVRCDDQVVLVGQINDPGQLVVREDAAGRIVGMAEH